MFRFEAMIRGIIDQFEKYMLVKSGPFDLTEELISALHTQSGRGIMESGDKSKVRQRMLEKFCPHNMFLGQISNHALENVKERLLSVDDNTKFVYALSFGFSNDSEGKWGNFIHLSDPNLLVILRIVL